MNITFIIPCYNCESFIKENFIRLKYFIKKNKFKAKIILIDDGSKDSTKKIINDLKNKNTRIIINKSNLGKSRSIINSLRLVKTDKVVLIDCDLPYFRYLKKVIINLSRYDLVTVNRRLKSSENTDKFFSFYQISRSLISSFLSLIIEKKLRLGVYGDTQAGLKAFKINNIIKKTKFISKFYFFDIELINYFKKKNLKIKLIPVKYKISSQSSIKFFSLKNFLILVEFINVIFRKKF